MKRERISLYVPCRLVRYYSKRVRMKPARYKHLSNAIMSSRLPLTVQRLLAIATFYPLLSFFVGVFVGYVILTTVIPEGTIIYTLYRYTEGTRFGDILLSRFAEAKFVSATIWTFIFGIVAYKLVEYLILSYPSFISSKRKGEIDIYLPHAVNMMYGMAVGGIGTYEIIKTVAEAKSMFGELSKEFGTVVQLTDIFREDFLSAIRHVRDTTPSERLSSFLDDFIFIIKGGGKLSNFLKNKSAEYFEEQEVSYTSYLDFLSVMIETYLAAFILLPLFLLVILIVMQMVGENILNTYRVGTAVLLPVATVLFIYLIKASLPIPQARTGKRELGLKDGIFAKKIETKMATFKVKKLKRLMKKAKSALLHPLEDAIYTIEFRIVSFYVLILAVIVTLIASRFLSLRDLPVVTLSAVAIPLILFVEIRERAIRQIEKRIPEIFRELAILNEAGLGIIGALKVLSSIELGTISKEINIIRSRIEWGEPISRAFRLLEVRIKSDVIAKVIPISVKAMETSPKYKDAFQTVSEFASAEVGLREKIRSSMFLYIVVIYLSISVFLLIAYIMIHNILSTFGTAVTGGVTFLPKLDLIKETFYQVSMLTCVLSGLIAGVIGSGKVLSGLKHAYVFLIATYFVFNYVL